MESLESMEMYINSLFGPVCKFGQRKLTESQREVFNKIMLLLSVYYDTSASMNFKFSGILLCGKPQSGKTEILKQVCLEFEKKYGETKVVFLDSSSIAQSFWGHSEKVLSGIFNKKMDGIKKIIIFDDIDCLFFGRERLVSQSYHISVGSVMFHLMDSLNPRSNVVLGTSNKPELLDSAMLSRFYRIDVNMPGVEDLENAAMSMLKGYTKINASERNGIRESIKKRIKQGETGFRDIQCMIIDALVEMKNNEKATA